MVTHEIFVSVWVISRCVAFVQSQSEMRDNGIDDATEATLLFYVTRE